MTNKTIIAQMRSRNGQHRRFIAAISQVDLSANGLENLFLGQVNSSIGTQLANEAKSPTFGGGAAVDGLQDIDRIIGDGIQYG